SFAVPEGSLDYWKSRFEAHHVFNEPMPPRFNGAALRFSDPDALVLELIESAMLDDVDLKYQSEVPNRFAIHGFHPPTLEVRELKPSEDVLAALGFELIEEEKLRRRFSVNSKLTSACVDLMARPDGQFGINSAGTVHHIAFRCADEDEQLRWRKQVV